MVATIADAPVPQMSQQLSSFLGLVNVYTEFLQDLATAAEHLHATGRKGATFNGDSTCQKAFKEIKRMISNNLVLALYDPNTPTFLSTDASGMGISAVLAQTQDGREVVVACASHTLQPAEQNYTMVKKEALACV